MNSRAGGHVPDIIKRGLAPMPQPGQPSHRLYIIFYSGCSCCIVMQCTHITRECPKDCGDCDGECRHRFLTEGLSVGDLILCKKLGEGRFSTVWSAKLAGTREQKFAVKFYRSGHRWIDSYRNELRVMLGLACGDVNMAGYDNIAGYISTGAHVHIRQDVRDDTIVDSADTGANTSVDVNAGASTTTNTIAPTGAAPQYRPMLYPYIVMQRADMSLKAWLRSTPPITINLAMSLCRQIAAGLFYMHRRNAIHADIKPDNILLKFHGNKVTVQLADFSSSTIGDKLFSRHVGTIPYVAPEILNLESYGKPADIFSACAVFFEIMAGRKLFGIDDGGSWSGDKFTMERVALERAKGVGVADNYSGNSLHSLSTPPAPVNRTASNCTVYNRVTSCSTCSTYSGDMSQGDSAADGGHDSVTGQGSLASSKTAICIIYMLHIMVGAPTKRYRAQHRQWYNSKGNLHGNPKLPQVGEQIVTSLGIFDQRREVAMQFWRLLQRGLNFNPAARPTAHDVLLQLRRIEGRL